MAERPVFIPDQKVGRLVQEVSIQFHWHPGMAPSQKKKNVASLHFAAARLGMAPLLEVSTKSDEKLGQRLSAFNLKVPFSQLHTPFESAYQGSKVFRGGGPYTDLYDATARDAKRDPRLRDSGPLIGFNFHGVSFPLTPKSAFYDYLYINALSPHREFLQHNLTRYVGFTDIEFNPERSINCQARACAIFVSLEQKQLLDACLDSFDFFSELLAHDEGERARERSSSSRGREPNPTNSEKRKAPVASRHDSVSETLRVKPVSIFDAGINQSKMAVALAEILMNWALVELQMEHLTQAFYKKYRGKHEETLPMNFDSDATQEQLRILSNRRTDYQSAINVVLHEFDKLKKERDPLVHSAWRPQADGFLLSSLSQSGSEYGSDKSIKIDAQYARTLASEIKQLAQRLSDLTLNLRIGQ